MTSEFDSGTAVTDQGSGQYAALLDGGWGVGGGLNGGYLLGVVANAVAHHLRDAGKPDPFSVSAHFLSPSVAGPACVEVELVKDGRQFATAAATLVQEADGERVPRIAAQATYGDLSRAHTEATDAEAAVLHLALEPPQLPPVAACFAAADASADFKQAAPLLDRIDLRLDPACMGWVVGKPSRTGMLQGWFRFADERPLDPIALLCVLDALPPVTFDLGLPGWAPTLELTGHVRARPAPGWAIVRHQTRTVAGGLFEEDCDVWDSTGRLVAQSRQLALQPR